MSRTLDEITLEIAKFHDALNASGGEIEAAAASMGMTPEQFTAAYDVLAFEDSSKLDAYLFRLEESKARESAAQAMVDQWEARIEEWKAKVKAEKKSQEWMKSRLKFNMEAKGETKVTTAEGRVIAIQKNGGKPPLIVDDEKFNNLPDSDFKELEQMGVIVYNPMLERGHLFDLIRGGTTFEWARIGDVGTHLRIK